MWPWPKLSRFKIRSVTISKTVKAGANEWLWRNELLRSLNSLTAELLGNRPPAQLTPSVDLPHPARLTRGEGKCRRRTPAANERRQPYRRWKSTADDRPGHGGREVGGRPQRMRSSTMRPAAGEEEPAAKEVAGRRGGGRSRMRPAAREQGSTADAFSPLRFIYSKSDLQHNRMPRHIFPPFSCAKTAYWLQTCICPIVTWVARYRLYHTWCAPSWPSSSTSYWAGYKYFQRILMPKIYNIYIYIYIYIYVIIDLSENPKCNNYIYRGWYLPSPLRKLFSVILTNVCKVKTFKH